MCRCLRRWMPQVLDWGKKKMSADLHTTCQQQKEWIWVSCQKFEKVAFVEHQYKYRHQNKGFSLFEITPDFKIKYSKIEKKILNTSKDIAQIYALSNPDMSEKAQSLSWYLFVHLASEPCFKNWGVLYMHLMNCTHDKNLAWLKDTPNMWRSQLFKD